MPTLSKNALTIDYTDDGQGPPVVLIHSSVSANRQWRALTEALEDRYRVLAINLFGYGRTTAWTGPEKQSLYAQARLVTALCEDLKSPIHLVGHSFGGAVALKSAALLGARVGKLILFEPNPFTLLEHAGRTEAFLEICTLGDHVRRDARAGDWEAAAARFADYWLGDGSWSEMPEKRRSSFIKSLPPLLHEFDAVFGEATTVLEWRALTGRTLMVSDTGTRRTIRELVAVFAEACPHWTFRSTSGGGHMAPLTHPEVVNPIVREFLDDSAALIQIREETPGDLVSIREVNARAFGQELEGKLVDQLRANGAALLSLVAIDGETVVGHILYSPASIAGVAGAALGPMAVLPEYQRKGVGTALVEAGNRRVKDTGCPFIVVLGHAEFYPRFGFTSAKPQGITCDWDVPDDVFMVAVLDPARMTGVSGRAVYRHEFSIVE